MTDKTDRGMDRRALLAAPLGVAAASLAPQARAVSLNDPPPPPEPWTEPLIRGYAPGPYGQIHYRETGGDGPPLIIFHQSPMTSLQFSAVYPIFKAAGIRAIGVDTPGFGDSDVTKFVPRVEDWAKIYPAVLDHLKIQRADLLGHHTGACTAAEVCLQYPDRVRKLAIHGAVMITDAERLKFIEMTVNRERQGPAYKMDGSHLTEKFLAVASRYSKGGTPDPKVITRFVIEEFSHTGPGWYGHYAAFVYDHAAALKKVKAPMLLINNTGDQIYVESQRLLKARPDIKYVELKGGAIDVVDQLPEQWGGAVVEFLKA
jgi:pimeloyl-ACP methyl ester carboxylesterase